jgi:hypothetical protein
VRYLLLEAVGALQMLVALVAQMLVVMVEMVLLQTLMALLLHTVAVVVHGLVVEEAQEALGVEERDNPIVVVLEVLELLIQGAVVVVLGVEEVLPMVVLVVQVL